MTNKAPERIYWQRWTQFVFTEFGQCEIDDNRIRNRSRYFHNAFVIELRCTHDTYRTCVAAVVDLYDGYCLNFKASEKRKLGMEYDYIIIFAKEPTDVEYYYLDSENVLRYYKPEDEE